MSEYKCSSCAEYVKRKGDHRDEAVAPEINGSSDSILKNDIYDRVLQHKWIKLNGLDSLGKPKLQEKLLKTTNPQQ